ncbi:hypothetical protein BN1723_010226 [Verticillium longisporum]|uniref:Uncharacterized protein n=1 Tax=Verticillium longisporum TaxID=100787 RepID=A0A0G4KWD5_VERLO|nr:hypothetical protein BN1723_010226 [Verticillium longisporum]
MEKVASQSIVEAEHQGSSQINKASTVESNKLGRCRTISGKVLSSMGANTNGSSSPAESKLKDRFSFNLGRRKSSNLLS